MKKSLDAYRGLLTPAQVAEGIRAAEANAVRLAKDARLLMEAGSFPTAASIAILAIEEAGKVSILRSLSLARSEVEANATWKEYRSHTRKNAAWLLPQLAAQGANKLEDLRPLFDEGAEHPYLLDRLKQLGFYTDCLGKANWSSPNAAISTEMATALVEIAHLLAGSGNGACSEREIELWVEHVGPVWRQDTGWMKQALVNWYAAMQEAGLKPKGENAMQQFVRSGVPSEEASNDADV
jgi:AbiV family abortive infection protein